MQEPEILSALPHLSAGKAGSPLSFHFLSVLRLNESSPSPAVQFVLGDAEVFKLALVEKAVISVGVGTMQKGRSRVDDAPQGVFGATGLMNLGCIAGPRIRPVSGALG